MWCTGCTPPFLAADWILFCEEDAITYLLRLKRGTSVPACCSAGLTMTEGKMTRQLQKAFGAHTSAFAWQNQHC